MGRVGSVGRASPPAAGLGRGVERGQGRELRQVAFVDFIGILQEEAGKDAVCQTYDFSEGRGGGRRQIRDPAGPRMISYRPESMDQVCRQIH